jgi:hypothetical protein
MEYRRTGFGTLDRAAVAGAVTAVTAAAAAAAMLPRAIAAAASIGRRPVVSSPTTASGSVGFTVVNGLDGLDGLDGLQSQCGDEISSGEQGTVFRHASLKGRVVKVFKNERRDAMQEIDKHAALNEINRLTGGKFRSLNAVKLFHDGRVSMVMDEFIRPMHHYLFGDSPRDSGDSGDMMRLRGYALRREQGLSDDRIFASATKDLLVQYNILHQFGVAHGDAHAGNAGLVLVGTDKTPRFVISDPTRASISPLSNIWEVGAAADFKAKLATFESMVTMMRRRVRQGTQTDEKGVFKYKLDEEINGLKTDHEVEEFIKELFGAVAGKFTQEAEQEAVDKSGGAIFKVAGKIMINPKAINLAGGIIYMHNVVVAEMERDRATLSENLGDIAEMERELSENLGDIGVLGHSSRASTGLHGPRRASAGP